jgi:DNA-binding transcriptional regulator YdaS (Cro superfamily)
MAQRHDKALARAIKAAGGYRPLAAKLDGAITYQAITQWRRVPAEWVVAIERATEIPREELRPDLYRN